VVQCRLLPRVAVVVCVCVVHGVLVEV
jgi:hypothetical protein